MDPMETVIALFPHVDEIIFLKPGHQTLTSGVQIKDLREISYVLKGQRSDQSLLELHAEHARKENEARQKTYERQIESATQSIQALQRQSIGTGDIADVARHIEGIFKSVTVDIVTHAKKIWVAEVIENDCTA